MAYGQKLGLEVVLGKSVEIFVTGKGQFQAELPIGDADPDDDRTITADTKAGLLEALRKEIRKARKKTTIPVTLFNWGDRLTRYASSFDRTRGLKDCYFRGTNSRTGDFLMQDEAGKKFTVDRYIGRDRLSRRFTPDQAERYLALAKAADDAATALKTFEEEVQATPEELTTALEQVDAAAGEDSADS